MVPEQLSILWGRGGISTPISPSTHKKISFIYVCMYVCMYGCVGSSLLHAGLLCYSKRGLLFVVLCGLLIAVASPVAEHGL